jgi:hypothetical protein
MSTSVNSLVTTFEKNILDSFTTETLEQAAQEIVDVRHVMSRHVILIYLSFLIFCFYFASSMFFVAVAVPPPLLSFIF